MMRQQTSPGLKRCEATGEREGIPMHRFWDPGANAELLALNPVMQVQRNPPSVFSQFEFWPQNSAFAHSFMSESAASLGEHCHQFYTERNKVMSMLRQLAVLLMRATQV